MQHRLFLFRLGFKPLPALGALCFQRDHARGCTRITSLERDLKREPLAARVGPKRMAPKPQEKMLRTDPRLLEEDGRGAAFNVKAQDARACCDDGESKDEGRELRDSWDKAQKQNKRPHRTDPRLLEEEALREEFDEAAQVRRPNSADDSEGEDGRRPCKSWKQRAQEKAHRRGRGRGYGMQRDGD